MENLDRPIDGALNGICPYFTMFPLDFPLQVLRAIARPDDVLLDPFCGRGTTNYAGRLLGYKSIGVDSNPVATALTQAKLANTTPGEILIEARGLIEESAPPVDVPDGEFWEWAFHEDVLDELCRLREGLLKNCESDARKALRALLLGALHGPRGKLRAAYFSNQSQRTYSPKPRYAVSFWKQRGLVPEHVDVLGIVKARAQRYYGHEKTVAVGRVILGDSTAEETFSGLRDFRPRVVVTSPPYYGMRTYISDQWLRYWFIGGPSSVPYRQPGQLTHSSPDTFASQLRQVWRNVSSVCEDGATMVIRYGGIHDRRVPPLEILSSSLDGSGWSVVRCDSAGTASKGRRQSLHFSQGQKEPIEEHDVWATWHG